MASALNSLYVVAIVIVGLAGSLFVASVQTPRSSSRWLELSSVAIVLLFVLLVGVQFLL
ncbi:MAG: hypothetical protein V5A39_07300 [Haloarculaceae archaeon]